MKNTLSFCAWLLLGIASGTGAAQAQYFKDEFASPAAPAPVASGTFTGYDDHWKGIGIDGAASATVGGGRLSFTGSASHFTYLGLVSQLSSDYGHFSAPVTYTIKGFSFAGSPEDASHSWIELHVGPSPETISDQSSSKGRDSTMFVLRLTAGGHLMGGSMAANTGKTGALDNPLPGLDKIVSDMPGDGVTLSLTLYGVKREGEDCGTGYAVTLSDSSGKSLYTCAGTVASLSQGAWGTGNPNQAVFALLLQESTQTGATPATISLASFAVEAGQMPAPPTGAAAAPATPATTPVAAAPPLKGASVAAATGASAEAVAAERTVYVAPDGDDAAAGLAESPLKTIARAVGRAVEDSERGKAVRVLIGAGVYRESVTLPRQKCGKPGALVIEAQPKAEVVVSGSDVWQAGWVPFHVENERWKWYSSDHRFDQARIYGHEWTYAWSDSENPWGGFGVILDPVAKRTEMVFMNGAPLRPVTAFGDLKEGTFCVNTDVKKLFVWPPRGIEPQSALTEVAVRTAALNTGERDNLVVRGLVFRHARSPTFGAAATIHGSRNVLVEQCRFEWNGWGGLHMDHSKDLTVRNCSFLHNGVSGTGGYANANVLFEDCQDAYNNWRGRLAGFVDWANGSKFFSTRTLTLRRYKSFRNETHGFWLDTDNKDVLIEDSAFQDNLLAGIFLESNQGPILLRHCDLGGNAVGIMDGRSDCVSLVENKVHDNAKTQISFEGDPNGRKFTAFDSSENLVSRSLNWFMKGNAIETRADGSYLVQVGRHFPNAEWRKISASMTAKENAYAAPTDASFCVIDDVVTFGDWKKQYALDLDSTFEQRKL